MPRFHIQIRERHRRLLLFLLGLVGSVLFLRQVGGRMEAEVLSEGQIFFMRLAQEQIGAEGSSDVLRLARCLCSRAALPVLWIILSFTALGRASLYLFWTYLGFAVGVLLWTVMVFGGWRGPFYFWGLVFPQYLIYVPALLLIDAACLRWNGSWRERRRYVSRKPVDGVQLKLFLLRIFLGISLYAAGIWAEYRLNPWILKKLFIKL